MVIHIVVNFSHGVIDRNKLKKKVAHDWFILQAIRVRLMRKAGCPQMNTQ